MDGNSLSSMPLRSASQPGWTLEATPLGRIGSRGGFSLLELVIVVVILGIVAAIAIPRMSRGSGGAADAALKADLATMREAIERYRAEHDGDWPGQVAFVGALTHHSNKTATEIQAFRDTKHFYGPYLREIPSLPVGKRKGCTGVAAVDGVGIGWIYNAADGSIKANTTTEADDAGRLYNTY